MGCYPDQVYNVYETTLFWKKCVIVLLHREVPGESKQRSFNNFFVAIFLHRMFKSFLSLELLINEI